MILCRNLWISVARLDKCTYGVNKVNQLHMKLLKTRMDPVNSFLFIGVRPLVGIQAAEPADGARNDLRITDWFE